LTNKFIVETISEISKGNLRKEHCCSHFACTSSNIHIVVKNFHNSSYCYDLSRDATINEVFCKLTLYGPWHSALFVVVSTCKLLYSGWEHKKSKAFSTIQVEESSDEFTCPLPNFLEIHQLCTRSIWDKAPALASLHDTGHWRRKFPITEHTGDFFTTLHASEFQLLNKRFYRADFEHSTMHCDKFLYKGKRKSTHQ
jgi:hypothetical protein